MKNTIVLMTAILCLGCCLVVALVNGINGVLFTSVSVIIAGIAGYKARTIQSEKMRGSEVQNLGHKKED